MVHSYEPYCLADRTFYDAPTRTRGDDVDFEAASAPVPAGWRRREMEDWLVYTPEDAVLPPQGWKVHVSSCLGNADEVLGTVFDYCVSKRLSFKFIRSRQLLLLQNAKHTDRGSSGKFMALYPTDEAQLEEVLTELGSLLEGQAGPYILSDLRWRSGPLYVRYGGFAERYCVGQTGELTLAIADETGELVPDHRGPTFSPPTWVPLPQCLAAELEARNSVTVGEIPYTFDVAIQFSNGGGLYSGTDRRTGEVVVLKEARPHAGLDTDGVDAIGRLRHEAEMLKRLAGLDSVPAFHDYLVVGDHHFLVQEFVDGEQLNNVLVDRYPLIVHDIDPGPLERYTAWALDIFERVQEAVDAVHERGIVIGDFHPSNVLVGPDDRIVLIDFETASPIGEYRRTTLADPGFVAPPDRTGFDVDRYALACLRLFLFLPLTNLLVLDQAKAEHLAEEIAALFPLPAGWLDAAVRVICGDGDGNDALATTAHRTWPVLDPNSPDWERVSESMCRAILASATPTRDDRLFPGDVKQFVTGGLNLAYGAAGVLYALAAVGHPGQPELEQWLIDRAVKPEPGTRLGFYDGLHGVAYALDYLGRPAESRTVLDICQEELGDKWDRLGLDLLGGLAGIGLNLLHFSSVTEATAVAEVLAARLGGPEDVPEISGGEHPYAGLLRGSSGPALFFIRLYEETGDGAFLDVARDALCQDLRRCYLRDDGALEVNEGWRSMPYLADGSIGIGMVLRDYLAHRENEQFSASARSIRKAAESQFYIEPGLFYGRAGMILYRSREAGAGKSTDDPIVASHIRRLSWHALTYKDELAFPGEQLLRLAMDLGTGTAGVLLAVESACRSSVHLPFLGPISSFATTEGR